MARETAIVQIAGTFSRSGWSQVVRYGRSAIIRIQNAGIPVAIVHLIRSHVLRFFIEAPESGEERSRDGPSIRTYHGRGYRRLGPAHLHGWSTTFVRVREAETRLP